MGGERGVAGAGVAWEGARVWGRSVVGHKG